MARVVFLVQHLVADQRPARGFHQLHAQALLAIETERIGHDQRARAGDGDKADLEIFLLGRGLVLCHRLERAEGEEGGHRCHRGRRAHRMEEAAPRLVPGKESSHHRRFDHAPVERLDVVGPRLVGDRNVVLRLARMPAAIAAGAEAHPGIEWVGERGHANLLETSCWYFEDFRIKRAKRERASPDGATSPYPTRSSSEYLPVGEPQKATRRASRWCAGALSWRICHLRWHHVRPRTSGGTS